MVLPRWEDITQTAPQTSQDKLTLGTQSCPSAYSEPHFRSQESRNRFWLPRKLDFLEYYDTSNSHPLMSLGVILHTWTWNKITTLIYSEVDLLHGKTAREFIVLWHSLALNHTVKVQSGRQMKPLMWRHLYLHFNCFLLLWNLYLTLSNTKPRSLITKWHNKWLHIINNINYHCAPYSFTKQSMRVVFFSHQDPINSMQLPNSWWHFNSKSSLLSSVCIIKIRCCNHLSLQ